MSDLAAPSSATPRPSEAFACTLCGGSSGRLAVDVFLYGDARRSIYQCDRCDGFLFWPVPSPDEVSRCYPHSYFKDFFGQYWKDYYKGRALVRRLKTWKAEGMFLDVGCALGTVLAGIRDFSRWQVAGLEYSPAAVEAGRTLHRLEIAPGGLPSAPWPDAHFDYVYGNNVLEHEVHPFDALRTAARLLKPGGRLHLVLPNGPVDLLPNLRFYRSNKEVLPTRHSGHVSFFTRKSLALLLARTGFEVLSIRTFHLKTAAKSRGWLPGSRRWLEGRLQPPSEAHQAEPSVTDYRSLIPRPRNWPLYLAQYQFRRLFRIPTLSIGNDFEVIARKI